MIKLSVEDYCQNCPYFDPEVSKKLVVKQDGLVYGGEHETDISCVHKHRCAVAKNYYEERDRMRPGFTF